jgi:hypothetical protein
MLNQFDDTFDEDFEEKIREVVSNKTNKVIYTKEQTKKLLRMFAHITDSNGCFDAAMDLIDYLANDMEG